MSSKLLLQGVARDLQLHNWWKTFAEQESSGAIYVEQAHKKLPKTELHAAKDIAKKFGRHVSYVSAEDRWYVWDGRVHRPIEEASFATGLVKLLHITITESLSLVKNAVRGAAESKQRNEGGPDSEVREAVKAKYTQRFSEARAMRDRLASNAGIRAVAQLLRDELEVSHDHFLDDRRWIVVRNGVFDMDAVRADREWVLLEHDPARPVYRMLDMDDCPGAEAPALAQYLHGSVQDWLQAQYLSKAVALAIMGVPQRTKTIVSLQGVQNSGKSMINDCLAILAKDFVASPGEAAITKGGTMKKEYARYPMRNARYIAFSEIREALDQQFLLAYTGGDRYTVEQKYMPSQTVIPQGIIFVATNAPLRVDKSDGPIFSRLSPINFPYTFTESGPDHIEDPELKYHIIEQSSGFLEWLKRSYLSYLEEGLDRPDSMEALKRQERDDEDPVADFLESTDRFSQNEKTPGRQCAELSRMHSEFLIHTRRAGQFYPDLERKAEFKRRLENLGYETIRSNGTRVAGMVSI